MYTRARAIPTNPNSPQQQAIRNGMATLSNRWYNQLSSTQRDDWDTYAKNVPVSNRLGEQITLSGINHYLRSNTAAVALGLTPIDDAPTTFNLGEFSSPSFGIDAAADEVDITFDNTDDWANEDGARMFVYCSRPQNASVNYFKGPYRFAGTIDGDSVAAPATPAAIALPFVAVVGQRIFVRVFVQRAAGRVSLDFRDFGLGA